jgi:hypothetical protein
MNKECVVECLTVIFLVYKKTTSQAGWLKKIIVRFFQIPVKGSVSEN